MTDLVVTAIINLDVPGPVISRHLYGHFAEHLGRCVYGGFYVGEDSDIPHAGGIRLDVVEALRALNIPNLHWPGGCFADEYHWMDGIGPKDRRPAMVNTHWGNVEENNHFGTHEFMALCELLGAEPYISGNVGSGTVREMSEWVEYLTREGDSPMVRLRKANGREQPWRVRFWGLGNEAWGCGGHMSAEQYAAEARRFGTYCRDHGDNKLYRIAAGANSDDYAWTETLMKQLGDLGCAYRPAAFMQALSLHYYTIPGTWQDKGDATVFDTGDYYRTMVQAARVDELIAAHSTVMDCYDPGENVGLVLDEWGTWWNVEPGTDPGFLHQQNTLRDALVASVHFDISMSASRKDGQVLISPSNLDTAEAADVELDLRGAALTGVRSRILTSGRPQDHNTPEAPGAVAPRVHEQVTATASGLRVHLPAHSFVTVEGRLA